MNKKTTIDSQEIAKFAQLSTQWWNKDGPLKTLHDINAARLQFIQKFVDLSACHVLDVGCGGGILAESMAKLGANVTGLDVEEDAITVARAHAKESGLDLCYVGQPIESFETRLFDVVTCMEMLEHASEPQVVIEHCSRLLKQGGYLFLSTINRTPMAYATAIIAAEYILELLPRQTHEFKKFIRPSELTAMTRAVGLESIAMSGMSYNPFSRAASLQKSVRVNYLLACQKS
ncbi:bifunctional 2-polyprenyl-6-hydroxyphenol methylase/3-demethylubiquinol 3-O-methyltransferase UbiG [Legionella nagasakiensis]|uniref:bifunctional 2-polyprenyl-6-hydroxyphenol methylase/3-demethylubiquinol 3-O-methyltransferase UbiG n=1 Tax=Legionella nagasakiensis TaxID=535290 RepID=UPI001055DAA0|nr:bifunctional 2-polyprenyl-6-hydroxyphenol methylase/3-demethylubiquinol 3-O-methyltransferase UbiG [Legionella nagasakiensis]